MEAIYQNQDQDPFPESYVHIYMDSFIFLVLMLEVASLLQFSISEWQIK